MTKNINRVISCIIALVLALSVFGMIAVFAGDNPPPVYDGTNISTSLSGEGTEASPYLIANGADLAFFATNHVKGAHYKLTNDIVWSSYKKGDADPTSSNWTPIVDFDGTFDGDGHYVSGVCVVSSDTNIGFFAYANGTIKNFTIKDSFYSGTDIVGGIVAKTHGSSDIANPSKITIDNCVNHATIKATKGDGFEGIGGIIGSVFSNSSDSKKVYTVANIFDCVNYGDVSATGGNSYLGGVVGRFIAHPGTVSGCANFGTITSNSAIVGGIAGQILFGTPQDGYTASITDCLNAGTVNGPYVIGGITGRSYGNTTITNCVNIGTVNATSETDNRCGAVDGHNVITSQNTYALEGSLVATAGSSAGDVGVVFKSADELNSAEMSTTLGEKWTYSTLNGLTLVSLATVVIPDVPGSDNTTENGSNNTTKPNDNVTTDPSDNTTTSTDNTTDPTDNTTDNPTDTTTSTNVTTKAPENTTAEPDDDKGCGGFAVSAQLIALLGVGVALVTVKKKF